MNKDSRKVIINHLLKSKGSFSKEYFNMFFNLREEEVHSYLDIIYSNPSIVQKANYLMLPNFTEDICSAKLYIDENVSINSMLKFCAFIFNKYVSKLYRFLWLKKTYEKSLVEGNYKRSLSILNQIENDVCCSLWTITKKMTLIDYVGGLQEHKKYVSGLLMQKDINPLIKRIVEIQSQFAEQDTNYSTYKRKVQDIIISQNKNDPERQYFDFKLCPERNLEVAELRISLMVDAQLSLIDLYETYVISLQALFINEGKIRCDYEYYQNDLRLINLKRIECNAPELFSSERYYSILELYTCGKYQDCIMLCKEYLIEEPTDFQALIIMIKSCVLSDTAFEMNNVVYKFIYNLYSFNGEENAATQLLLSSLKLFTGTSMEYKILSIVARKTYIPNYEMFTRMSVLCDNNLSPNVTNFPDLIKPSPNILDSFTKLCPITTNLFMYKHGLADFPKEIIDKDRGLLFKADEYISKNDAACAINILDSIERTDTYYKERILRRRIRAYRLSGDYYKMIKCISDSILDNSALTKRLDLKSIFKEIKRHLTKEIKNSIYYVVFVYICFPDDIRQQRIAYVNYMEGNNLNSIDEICTHVSDYNALVFFLDEVCRISLLKRDEILNPKMNEADKVRINILRHLISIDPTHERKYYLEISAITTDMSIKERIRQINNSRVYVDVENIRKEIEDDLQREFIRYIAMGEIDGEKIEYYQELIGYENIKEKISENEEFQKTIEWIVNDMNSRMKNNPLYHEKIKTLEDLISLITEAFLFDEKYGLNTFLSSRVRHGFCKSQLTSSFDKYKLLSKKRTNTSLEYPVNEYWDKKLPKDCPDSDVFRKCLSDFTSNIERMVETVKDKWLNIKYKDPLSNALLDYTPSFTALVIIIESHNFSDCNDLFNQVINVLWDFTDYLFEKVKDLISNQLSTFFSNQLTTLAENVSGIKNDSLKAEIDELNKNVILCKANYEKSLYQFATVLDRNNVVYYNFTMEDLVDTCLEIENRLNIHFNDAEIRKNIKDKNVYKGEFFPYFVDVITILLNNAFEHSEMQSARDVKMIIDISKEQIAEELRDYIYDNYPQYVYRWEEQLLIISISNLLDENVDINARSEKMRRVFEELRNPNNVSEYLQKEGGTGLLKLNNTLQSNIKEPFVIFYAIENRYLIITIMMNSSRLLDK